MTFRNLAHPLHCGTSAVYAVMLEFNISLIEIKLSNAPAILPDLLLRSQGHPLSFTFSNYGRESNEASQIMHLLTSESSRWAGGRKLFFVSPSGTNSRCRLLIWRRGLVAFCHWRFRKGRREAISGDIDEKRPKGS